MEKGAWIFIMGAVVVLAGVMYALSWNAGDLSRQEEAKQRNGT